jgi:hypothetical protein
MSLEDALKATAEADARRAADDAVKAERAAGVTAQPKRTPRSRNHAVPVLVSFRPDISRRLRMGAGIGDFPHPPQDPAYDPGALVLNDPFTGPIADRLRRPTMGATSTWAS